MIQLSNDILNMPLREARRVFEREYFKNVISRFYVLTEAAKFVRMERSALHRKLITLGLTIKRDD